jgi:hypothetical protein
MNAVAECEEKPQFQAKKEIANESKIILDTIIDHFKFFGGDIEIRPLWQEPDYNRYRVNWWNKAEGKIVKSSFVVLAKKEENWVVQFAS